MLRIKTLYLNIPKEIALFNIRAELEDSYIIRFCNHTVHTYATILSKISEVFLQIEVGVQNGYIQNPSKISILLPKYTYGKFKSTDEEITLERILWVLNNLKPPTNGLIISLYINDKNRSLDLLDSHWNLTNLNYFKETWTGGGDYVTIQLPEKFGKKEFYKNIDFIMEYLNSKNIPIKYISYETSLEEAYRLLLKSKLHIGYIGSLYFIAAAAKVPTLGLGITNYRGLLEYYNKNGKKLPYINKLSRNLWGMSSMAQDRVLQYDESGKIINSVVAGSIDISLSNHTIKRLLKNVIEKNNYSEFWYKMIKVESHENFIKGTTPWSYIYIDNYLSPEEFSDLRSKAFETGPPTNNEVSREIFDYDPTPQIELLFPLLKNDTDFRVRNYTNLKKFIHFAVTPSNFIHKMHIEAPFKIMSAVLYLGPEENRGTRLYETPDGEPFEIEWKPNRLFVFCGYDHTFHDYLSSSVRYTYNYFLVDEPTVENPEYKENLLDLEYIEYIKQ